MNSRLVSGALATACARSTRRRLTMQALAAATAPHRRDRLRATRARVLKAFATWAARQIRGATRLAARDDGSP